MVIIRHLKFSEWIKPLKLSAQILDHTSQPQKLLLQVKLPISLLVLKLYNPDTIYVAEEDGKIIGICLAQMCKDKLLIEGTVIDPQYRRRGISNKLKRAVEEKAVQLGATVSVTKIEPDNLAALTMAKKQGYHETNEAKMYEKALI